MVEKSNRTGVFFCNCDGKFSDSLDFKAIKKELGLVCGEIVQEVPGLCKEEGQSQLSRSISAAALNGLVVAGCRENKLSKQCLHTAQKHGIGSEKVSFINLEDLCVNVHSWSPELNQKAARLTQQALVGQRLQGRIVVKDVKVEPAVLVVGDGPAATAITQELIKQQPVVVLGSEEKVGVRGATYLPQYKICKVGGNNGNFTVALLNESGEQTLHFGGIVLVLGTTKVIDPSIKLPEEPGIVPLSKFSCDLEKDWSTKSVAFVLGDAETQFFESTEFALEQAIKLCRSGAKVDFFFQQMKVAGENVESKYREARKAGVRFDRYEEALHTHVNVLGITIKYIDPLLPQGKPDRVLVDYLVAGEVELPTPETNYWAEILEINAGTHVLEADSRPLLFGEANREGIFTISSCYNSVFGRDYKLAAQAIAAKFSRFVPGKLSVPQLQAVVDPEQCTFCLTCHRICAHRAVEIDDVEKTVFISPLACKSCGTCVVECPNKAIELPRYLEEQIQAQLCHIGKVVAFACENSGFQAAELAGLLKRQYPVDVELLKVPCAGRIDPLYVLQALEHGAHGVLLLVCHPENCKSLQGYNLVEPRLQKIRRHLVEAGVMPERIESVCLAANSGHKFADTVNSWIAGLEPQPVSCLQRGEQV